MATKLALAFQPFCSEVLTYFSFDFFNYTKLHAFHIHTGQPTSDKFQKNRKEKETIERIASVVDHSTVSTHPLLTGLGCVLHDFSRAEV